MTSASPARIKEASWTMAVVSAGICARDTSRAREWFRRPSYNPYPMPRSEPIRAARGIRDILPAAIPLWRLAEQGAADVVRAYFDGGLNQGPQPTRLYLIGPMFRHDKPQKGRYRQFFQFNVEVIGGASAGFDAEVIELAISWLNEVGLQDLRLELNSI